MNLRHLPLAGLLMMSTLLFGELPSVSTGRIERLENFPSAFVAPRNVDVWLPEGYDPEGAYAVVYMHDGQVLFDPTGTFQQKEWDVETIVGGLLASGKVRPCIVVGVWNTGLGRHADYCPEKPFRSLPEAVQADLIQQGRRDNGVQIFDADVRSDAYLKFLVEELKPLIDRTYATLPDRENTFIMGSSMGGLISIYAICEYPEVFGAAACLSTHWPMLFRNEDNPFPDAMQAYLSEHLPDPATHRLYFDHGTATLDALYPVHQQRVDALLREKGYGQDNWTTRIFPGAVHTEDAWRERLHIPFQFLLGKD